MLVTSRAVLQVRGERKFDIAPLAVPDLHRLPSLDMLRGYAAVELFVQRAQDVYPDFTLSPANAPAVAELCVRLDGLPLAIELAAARSHVLSPQALLVRLQHAAPTAVRESASPPSRPLDLLTGGAQDLPARQRTIRAAMAWSYTLLAEDKRTLFRRLGVFAGGWTLEAAGQVCTADQELNVLDGIAALLDTSLLLPIGETGGERRFGMLETLREYARECLEEHGELALMQQRQAVYYLTLAKRAAQELRGPEQLRWIDMLEAEHANLQAALQWFLEGSVSTQVLQLIAALGRFWFLRGHWSAWEWWLSAALERLEEEDAEMAALHANVLLERGMLALYVGDHQRAVALGTDSLRRFRAVDDSPGIAAALVLAVAQEPNPVPQLEEAVRLAQEVGDAWLTAWRLHALGQMVGASEREAERARVAGEASLVLAQQTGDAWLIGRAFTSLGWSARAARDLARAEGYFRESLTQYRQVRDRLGVAWALEGLGSVAFERGNYAEAREHEERLAIESDLGNRHGMLHTLWRLARVALEMSDIEHAHMLGERSLALGRELGSNFFIAWSLLLLGRAKLVWGDAEGAKPLLEEILVHSRKLDVHEPEVDALVALGWAALATNEPAQAQARLAEGFVLAQAAGYAIGVYGAVEGLAGVGARSGTWERAARLFGAAASGRERSGCRAHPSDRALAESSLLAVHDALGELLFEAAWSTGQHLQLEEIVPISVAEEGEGAA
jgi:predicted ATPase